MATARDPARHEPCLQLHGVRPGTRAGGRAVPGIRHRVLRRHVYQRDLRDEGEECARVCSGVGLRGQRDCRGIRGRSHHALCELGTHRDFVRLFGLGEWDRSRAAVRHAVPDHSGGLGSLAPGGRHHSLRGDGVSGIRPLGAGDCGHQPDLRGVWHQGRVPVHAQLATGRLPERDCDRHRLSFCIYHQACDLCTGTRICGRGDFDSDRCNDDRVPNLLCRH